jgi:5-methylcytosine-specific restriction enzyme subunit McrC
MRPAISVKNLYFLLLYAWNKFDVGHLVDVSGVSAPELPNLLSKILLEGSRVLLTRGLDRGYQSEDEITSRPRGRILVGSTVSRALLARAQIAVSVDNLSYDVLHNRILKTTLLNLAVTDGVDRGLAEGLRANAAAMAEVPRIELTSLDFRRIQVHGNNAFYDFLLKVCGLAHQCLLPEKAAGHFKFRDALGDDERMRGIFQEFVKNFFKLEQDVYRVRSEAFAWRSLSEDRGDHHLMPRMITDVFLRSPSKCIIIECKWTTRQLNEHYGKRSFRSDHLYQLFAYLRNAPRNPGDQSSVEGILLYPKCAENVDALVEVSGHRIRVRTIDLGVDWAVVHAQLLSLLDQRSMSIKPMDASELL